MENFSNLLPRLLFFRKYKKRLKAREGDFMQNLCFASLEKAFGLLEFKIWSIKRISLGV